LALSRNPSSIETARDTGSGFGRTVWERFRRALKARRDRRLLQSFSDSLLADIGLERIEFRSAADGRRDIRFIPHRS
jgi:uncharacterized protein YjiS (DUF1127 family)